MQAFQTQVFPSRDAFVATQPIAARASTVVPLPTSAAQAARRRTAGSAIGASSAVSQIHLIGSDHTRLATGNNPPHADYPSATPRCPGGRSSAEDLHQVLTELLPRLRRFGLSLTGSTTDADDLVQGACERALLRAEQLRDLTRIDAWLYGIMRNLWIDELRRRRIRRHEDIEAAADVVGDHGQDVVDSRITLEAVRRTILELPEDYRTLLMLVCVDGMSYKDTAELLRIPLGTVMSRLSRARQDLQTRMTDRGTGKS